MALTVNIIGAGNLGKTIGHLLVKHNLVKIAYVCNRSEGSALNAIKFIGQGEFCSSINKLPSADITFITTPDDQIKTICEQLSKNPFLKQGGLVIHCSGSLTSDALISAKQKGCFITSIHPMRSFAKPELSVKEYKGTYCAIEGDKEALSTVQFLFNSIGSITYLINKEKKSSYHAAGVFASNYLVTLGQQALLCMQDAGVSDEMAMQVITNIMKGTVSNLQVTSSPKHSLTGPIKRGDTSTVIKHLQSFSDIEQRQLYSALGKATLHLTDHDKTKKAQIESALDNACSLDKTKPLFLSRL